MKPTLVFFTSPGCAPCRALKPIIEQLQAEFEFPVRYVEISPETVEECVQYQVRSAPTLIAVEEGSWKRVQPTPSRSALEAALKTAGVI